MEVIINLKNVELNFEINKVYSIVAYKEKNKDRFLKDVYSLNKEIINYVDLNNYDSMFNSNTYLDITNSIKNIEIVKLQGFLDLFKLDKNIMKKNFYELSNSEKKKIVLISAFLSEKKVLFIDNSTVGLDKGSKLELLRIIKHEKRNNKVIILFSMDSNFIYEISDKIVDIEKNNILDVNKFFSGTKKVKQYGLEIPDIEIFKKDVLKRKRIKLSKVNNINDLIKDVYRNVQ